MPLPINIEVLLSDHVIETERIELKKGWNPQVVLHSICAFANDFNNFGGGYIVVGVEENEGLAVMPPVGIDSRKIDNIQKELLRICHYISPNYFPIVEISIIQGQSILTIWCPPGDVRPYKAPKGLADKDKHTKVYYIRRLSSTIIAKDLDEQRLLELTAKVPFDNRINHHATINDLNLTHIASFLKEVNSSLYTELPNLALPDLCRNMDIARGSVEELRPLNVGLLMFSDDPTQHFRGARIELVEFQDDIGDKFREIIFNGPLWLQLKDVLRYIRHSIIKEQVVKIDGKAEADRYYNYPYEALEEAIANAVFHKGYDEQSPIEVSIRHDCIEILSFPGPVPPVNNESLKLDRIIARSYRNSRLGDFLKELHLTECRSTGIPKIRRFMKRNESPEPKFETDHDNTYFLTTFYPHVLDDLSDTVVTESQLGDQSEAQSRDQVGNKSKPNEINPPNKLLEELRRKDQVKAQSRAQSKVQSGAQWGDGLDKQQSRILDAIGLSELSSGEIVHEMGLKSKSGSFKESLSELIKQGEIEYTIPENPKSRLQKYRLKSRHL